MEVFVAVEYDAGQPDREETDIIGVFADESDARAAINDYDREFGSANRRAWVEEHTVESDWVTPGWMDHPDEQGVA
jgi:hypothetical protein